MWALCILSVNMGNATALRVVFGPLQELAKRDLSLTDFQISLVQGLATSIPIALLSIPIGRWADRASRVRMLPALILVSIGGSVLTFLAQSFNVLFLARMLAGLAAACAIPAAGSLVADLTPPNWRGRANLLWSLGVSGGTAIAFAAGGWFSEVSASGTFTWLSPFGLTSWRAAEFWFAILSALLIIPLFWLREPPRQEVGAAGNSTLRPVLHELWMQRRFLLPLWIAQVCALMVDIAATIWAAPVLVRDHGLRPSEFGAWMGLLFMVPGVLGGIIGGYLVDLGYKRPVRGGILSAAVGAAILSIPAALYPVMSHLEAFAALLGLLLFCGAVSAITTTTVITVLIPNELRGMCMSGIFVLSAVFTFGIVPMLVPVLSGVLGGDAHLAQSLTIISVAGRIISAVAFIVAMLRAPRKPT